MSNQQALQEQKDSDRSAVHTVVKEQMHKLRHDFLSKFQADGILSLSLLMLPAGCFSFQ